MFHKLKEQLILWFGAKFSKCLEGLGLDNSDAPGMKTDLTLKGRRAVFWINLAIVLVFLVASFNTDVKVVKLACLIGIFIALQGALDFYSGWKKALVSELLRFCVFAVGLWITFDK